MDNMYVLIIILHLLFAIGIFAVWIYIAKWIVNKVTSNERFKNSRFSNPLEYFPSEELFTLKQVFYLIMMLVFIVMILYMVFSWKDGSYPIFVLDMIISIYLVLKMEVRSLKDKVLLFLLIPFGSITKIMFGDTAVLLVDIFHIIGYLYFIHVYYRKFVEFTENNSLGIAILLLFSIVWVSFLFTMLVEDVSPLDSIVMVSNAFTSNSFDASGNSVIGKLDSLVLAWGGFILSGVGTATLAVSIIQRYTNRQFDDMEKLIKSKKKMK